MVRDTLELLFSFIDTHGALLIHILPNNVTFSIQGSKNLTPLIHRAAHGSQQEGK